MITVSTHVLDGALGGGLGGVTVQLYDEDGTVVASGVTGEDGRITELASGISPGTYRIVWETRGSFIGLVSAEVDLGADRHYHVAVVASGSSATVYLGA